MFAIDVRDDRLDVAWQGEPCFAYHFGPDAHVPYWHPLRLPAAPALTEDRPQDHIHHHGMWLTWKMVDGINFWEQPKEGADPKGFGRIRHTALLEHAASKEQARFGSRGDWVDADGVTHLRGTIATVVHAPASAHMTLDATFELSATERPVVLDLKRGEPGKGGLFYSGLTVRFDRVMTPGALLDSEGRTEADAIYGSRARWCGWSGTHPDDGKTYGVTVIDHPDNPRHPSPWWVRNKQDYALIQPSLCYGEPLTISPASPLLLRYRLVIHAGPVDAALIESVGATF